MDFGDFPIPPQNNRGANKAANKKLKKQKKEIKKLHREQEKTNEILQAQEKEKSLQSDLYELTAILEGKYQQLLTENDLEKTVGLAKEFLENLPHYKSVTDQKAYSTLEYKNLAAETRSTIDSILDRAITTDLNDTLKEITFDFESISNSPTEELALQLNEKYGRGYSPKILDDPTLLSPHHKELSQQAKSTREMIRQNEWFRWGSDQIEYKRKKAIEEKAAAKTKSKQEALQKRVKAKKEKYKKWGRIFSAVPVLMLFWIILIPDGW